VGTMHGIISEPRDVVNFGSESLHAGRRSTDADCRRASERTLFRPAGPFRKGRKYALSAFRPLLFRAGPFSCTLPFLFFSRTSSSGHFSRTLPFFFSRTSLFFLSGAPRAFSWPCPAPLPGRLGISPSRPGNESVGARPGPPQCAGRNSHLLTQLTHPHVSRCHQTCSTVPGASAPPNCREKP
jgi:hypothetical protein